MASSIIQPIEVGTINVHFTKKSIRSVTQALVEELIKQINTRLTKAIPKIEKEVQLLIVKTIKDTDLYEDLLSRGSVFHEFGVPDIITRLDAVIDVWTSSVQVEIVPITRRGNGIKGGLRITAIKSDWADVLSIPEASFITPENQFELPWLEWLLLKGPKHLIGEYGYAKRVYAGSRTGKGVILPVEAGGLKRRWKVPDEHQGTVKANFVTKAIKNIDATEFDNIIQKSI